MDTQKTRFLREKLRQLEMEAEGRFKSDQGCCGLTLSQCHTLLEVGNREEVSLVELATYLRLDASTLSRTVNGLVVLGLINRLTNERDRRLISLSLTERGKNLYDDIEATFNTYYSKVLEIIPEEIREMMVENIALFSDAVRKYNDTLKCCRQEVLTGEGEIK